MGFGKGVGRGGRGEERGREREHNGPAPLCLPAGDVLGIVRLVAHAVTPRDASDEPSVLGRIPAAPLERGVGDEEEIEGVVSVGRVLQLRCARITPQRVQADNDIVPARPRLAAPRLGIAVGLTGVGVAPRKGRMALGKPVRGSHRGGTLNPPQTPQRLPAPVPLLPIKRNHPHPRRPLPGLPGPVVKQRHGTYHQGGAAGPRPILLGRVRPSLVGTGARKEAEHLRRLAQAHLIGKDGPRDVIDQQRKEERNANDLRGPCGGGRRWRGGEEEGGRSGKWEGTGSRRRCHLAWYGLRLHARLPSPQALRASRR